MDSIKISMALSAYYESRGKKLDAFSAQGFMKRVQDYTEKSILEAIEEARFSDKFPDVVVPLNILRESGTVDSDYGALSNWFKFESESKRHPLEEIKFDDPIAALIVERSAVGEKLGRDKFISEYKAMKRQEGIFELLNERPPKALTGIGKKMLEKKLNDSKLLSEGKND